MTTPADRFPLSPEAQALRKVRDLLADLVDETDDLIRRQDAIDDAEVDADLDAWQARFRSLGDELRGLRS